MGLEAESDSRNFKNSILIDELFLIEPLCEQFDSVWHGSCCVNCGWRKRYGDAPVVERPCLETEQQGIDRLASNTISPNKKLESTFFVFSASVHRHDAINKFTNGNASPIVAHIHCTIWIVNRDINLPSSSCHELIHSIVHDLLEQDIDTVMVARAVADFADGHSCAIASAEAMALQCRKEVIYYLRIDLCSENKKEMYG